MRIKPGDQLPQAVFTVMTAEGPTELSTADLFGGRKVALFAMPGAFTPTCHTTHLAGVVAGYAQLREKGADMVACTAVNDIFVLEAWARAANAPKGLVFLADGNGDFARAMGLEQDMSALGMGVRSRRYALIVDNGRISALFLEDARNAAKLSGAQTVLAAL